MRILFALVVAALVVAGHVGLWTSDRVPAELKADLTRINATAWAVVLMPAGAVALWRRAQRRRGRERRNHDRTE
ncbi:phenylalanyl-tRNA synthetase subunit beta [Rhodosalinus halophilus]|uniref:Phenylalanyl-tRNA synthetase subunit beta n=1 Tax=Rhodosalinus halophilus TaxID=2259333 RepID=A0A365UCN8_9RHOB|nr:phenylalanyl-tRNA synthetase subunit beta [Rhodosalinus halophilus]RBI86388.1 phenylalanyl-tRNA synthetase subunit beta [Rhodosalinus halophilus]